MASFLKAYRPMQEHEGGYSNRKNDRGRETYRGISRKYWPDWKGWKIVDRIKEPFGPKPEGGAAYRDWVRQIDRALEKSVELGKLVEVFYAVNFWNVAYNKIESQELVNWLFDKAVNAGVKAAHKWLQRALGVNADGIIGPQTLKAVTECRDIPALIDEMKQQAKAYYIAIVDNDPTQRENLAGWLSRI